MSKIIFVLLFCSAVFFNGLLARNLIESPIVSTHLGQIQGAVDQSFLGREYVSFRGIPYAEPPTENYRFKVHILTTFVYK